jgi:3-oxoacyl-[acyl-carrier-protein] synthase II
MSLPVAITGSGAITAAGADPGRWLRGPSREAGSLLTCDVLLASLPEAARTRAARAERVTQLVLAAGGAALASAGLDATDGPPRPRHGTVLGTAFGCFLTNAAYQRRFAAGGPPAASPRLFAATVSNAAAGELSIAYRLGGPAVTLTAGAASGLTALAQAVDILRAGGADALVSGGMDALGATLERWLADGGLAIGRPPAEAAALLVVEPLATARTRGVRVLGTVDGCGLGFEPDPFGADAGGGLAHAIATALVEAGASGETIGLVVSAAPPALAALEARALHGSLGTRRPPVAQPKDMLGETFGAAGPLGLLAALAEAPPGAAALVLDACASGHVAAAVVRGAEA